ncbi:MAG: DUF5763 domain-containing protein [Planctomycetota bacterium]|nr:DUF5763 domain-containing protein [Planctomycetota bacterium]
MIELGFDDACRAMKRDGTPCRIRATSLGFCIFHDPTPEERERRVRNARAAGKASVRARRERKRRVRALHPVELKTVGDATVLLQQTVNELREGRIDPPRARLQIKAATEVLRYSLGREVEERLGALEGLVKEHELVNPEAWAGAIHEKSNAWRGPRA